MQFLRHALMPMLFLYLISVIKRGPRRQIVEDVIIQKGILKLLYARSFLSRLSELWARTTRPDQNSQTQSVDMFNAIVR